MRALAQVRPDAVSAGVGNLKVAAYSGQRAGGAWVYMDIVEGSYGGRPDSDGLDAVDTLYANTRNNPIEDIESHYPLRVRRYELAEGGGGAGRTRGGLGSIREIEFLEAGGVSLEGDGNATRPPGLFGGGEGSTGSVTLNPGPGERALPTKLAYTRVSSGEVLRLVGPCGGGYGDPGQRDPDARRRDAADGFETASKSTSLPTRAGERTLAGDLATAAQIGAVPEGGINRFAWTPELAEATEWVAEELERLGLEVEIDAAGNLLGRWPAHGTRPVMTASHLDTVPNGGAFDGVLGVSPPSRRSGSCAKTASSPPSPSGWGPSWTRRARASAPRCSAAARSPASTSRRRLRRATRTASASPRRWRLRGATRRASRRPTA